MEDKSKEIIRELIDLTEKQMKSMKLVMGLTDIHLRPQIEKINRAKAFLDGEVI